MKALIITLVLLGPVSNIIINAKESARVLECTTYLTYNLTRTRIDLAIKPFTNAFVHLNLSEVEKKFQEVHDVVEPVYQEIEIKSRK